MSHLIVVDVQNEWRTEWSDYYVGDLADLVRNINTLIDACRQKGDTIIFIRHVEKDAEDAFAEDTERSALMDELHRDNADIVITKHKISPFYKTNLESLLEGSEQVTVCGILTNLCVRSLVNDLYDRDFNTVLVEDCCVAMDKETHEFTLEDIENTRPEIKIVTLDVFTR